METKQALLRQLPAISIILQEPRVRDAEKARPHLLVAEAASEVVQDIREKILDNEFTGDSLSLDKIIDLVLDKIAHKAQPSLKRVINATGIVLHTNLGRAVLSREAVKAINDIAGSYSNLEFDLSTGERGTRYAHVEKLLCKLTGAEAGLVVNNNAAAVLLVLNTLAQRKEVIVSRGQMVEIGGSFRIPDVMTQSGAKLVEVGTTNKTHLRDYERVINENTALLLKVHTSNYKIIGFTSEVSATELVKLGEDKVIPVYEDLGSGVLIDFANYGISHEPTVSESVQAGVDIVTCSGDKLFGGPQAGIIVGRRDLIDQIKKNPLTRALRIDKFTLVAMEATLRLYLDEEKAIQEIPTLHMITMSLEELREKAEKFRILLDERLATYADVEVTEGFSQVGGGALPEENIPTVLLALSPKKISVNTLEERLRQMNPPVLARIQKDKLLFDPRTMLEGDENIIIGHLVEIMEME